MRVVMVMMLIGLSSTFVFALFNQDRAADVQGAIKKIEQDLSTAFLKGDVATVDRVLADGYLEINSQGELKSKSDLMSFARARANAPRAISAGPEVAVSNTELRLSGDTAIYVGLQSTRYQHMQNQVSPAGSQSPDSVIKERFLKVYVKEQGRWRLAASQTTIVN